MMETRKKASLSQMRTLAKDRRECVEKSLNIYGKKHLSAGNGFSWTGWLPVSHWGLSVSSSQSRDDRCTALHLGFPHGPRGTRAQVLMFVWRALYPESQNFDF